MTAVEPAAGIFPLTDEEYFAPALASTTLSSTGAKTLLAPGGPARFRHQLDTGTAVVKREYDLGHAVHTLVLGSGPEPVLFPGTGKNPEAWQKEDDKAAVAKLRAEGKVPLRPTDFAAAWAMASAVRNHPVAAKLFYAGEPEQALIWRDPTTGVMCRAKADWLRPDGIVDLKTAESADAEALSKATYNHGYYIQAAFYLRGFRELRQLAAEPFFVFAAVEKSPPYLVHVHQLTERAMAHGDRKVAEALEIYRDCTASGAWPGYPLDEITDTDLPGWIRTEEW
ncbi:PD-(D/E)XK nuclease-like domain-containing protein [Actinoplanes palleronii]|uniref:Putative exodeoxyribonuclease 8 PDDEXK-like domain-containing protein n=1 Tax=Actinoplanes palleronii TaxID=113570 RepID=A0ABQ4BJB4_9ACTN|nr:PD-(D/E)XK nuclease-like domain-containing protein [Actinoplanes palleronii]GIE70776.1 hypothetical protein Apa02nite_068840 [Actinoplanes palleronii]